MRILICGHRSFAATGLQELLEQAGHNVETFSRGAPGRAGPHVTGDVFRIQENEHLGTHYDIVINFVLIKGGSVEENIDYAKALVAFCNNVHPRALLQISSISVFPREAPRVIESTSIAELGTPRGPYAEIKSAVDHALASAERNFLVSYLRPGFIVDSAAESPSMTGIASKLVGKVHVLMGDQHTPLPLLSREQFHESILRIIGEGKVARCYLLFANNGSTKLHYARKHVNGTVLSLPRVPTLLAARVLRALRIFSPTQYAQVTGLFCRTEFCSEVTEESLGMKFQ